MPYFVYKVDDDRSLEHIETFESFSDAKKLCRDQRTALKSVEPVSVRIVFAKNQKEAESLLRTPRKPSTPLEEWEG